MTFSYFDRELEYFDHPYNNTRKNERAVEIPIALDWLPEGQGLEIGNVLEHYGVTGHQVVDRYEEGCDNIDLFEIHGNFDWILAISTLEHVRWDPPEPRDIFGSIEAIDYLLTLLRPGGKMLVTIPYGSHPGLDMAIMLGSVSPTRDCVFMREGDGWVQQDRMTWKPYGLTTIWAETVWIGEWQT